MNIELPLDGMTWAELRAFVDLGKHLGGHEEVTYDFNDQMEVQSLFITGWTPEGQ